MNNRQGNSPIIRIAALLAVLVVVAAACSAGDDADSGAETVEATSMIAADRAIEFEAPEGVAFTQQPRVDAASGGSDEAAGGEEPPVQQIRSQARDIIFTADVSIAATDVATAAADAVRIVESLGGFVFGQDASSTPVTSSTLTFRIDPQSFQQALDELAAIGDVRTQTVNANDVTGTVVDLESRILTAEASVVRLRAFLENATTVEQVATLERELLARETELETMRGQLRSLRDQVALASIVVRLSEALSNPALELNLSAYPGHDDAGASCPGSPGIGVEKGGPTTLCFQLVNVGDAPLAELELTDSVLGIELSDLMVVFGDPTDTLEPGQTIDLAYEIEVSRDLRTQTRVTATPVNADGEPVAAREVARTDSLFVAAIDPGGLPGFGDGLSAGWELLQNMVGVFVLTAGAILPFVWVVPVAWLLIRMRRRRPGPAGAAPDPSAG